MTLADIRTRVKLFSGREQALVVQQFQTLERVVSLAFGPAEKEKPPEVQNKAELKSRFAAVFGSK